MSKSTGEIRTTVVVYIILALLGTLLLNGFFSDYSGFVVNKDYLVPVLAEVTEVSRFENEDNQGYRIYVSYHYENKSYSNILWQLVSSDEFKVGDRVEIEISTKNPEYIENCSFAGDYLLYMLLLSIFVTGLFSEPLLKKFFMNRTIDETTIMWGLLSKGMLRFFNIVIAFTSSIAGTVFFSLGFRKVFALGSIFAVVVGLWAIIIQMRNTEEYKISKNRCLRKWTESDTDYTWHYVEFENIPKPIEGKYFYSRSEEGEFYYVLANASGKIKCIYNAKQYSLNVKRDNFEASWKKIIWLALINNIILIGGMVFVSFVLEAIARSMAI